MPNIADYQIDKRIFALLVGRSGDGKSAAAASFPKPYLEYDFDLRFGGIKAATEQGWLKADGIEYVQFNPMAGWEPVEKELTQLDSDRLAGRFRLKSLGVGSLTSLARLLVNFSHDFQGGRRIGFKDKSGTFSKNSLRVSGPADFNLEQTGVHQFFDHLRTYPCNILVTAHIVDKWGRTIKADGDEYRPPEIIGEKLSIRENLGENVQSYFSNVWRFSREFNGKDMKYYVEFATDLAKNEYGIGPGKYDITNKEFFPFLQGLIEEHRAKK